MASTHAEWWTLEINQKWMAKTLAGVSSSLQRQDSWSKWPPTANLTSSLFSSCTKPSLIDCAQIYISWPCQFNVTSPHCLAHHDNLLPTPPMHLNLHYLHTCNTLPTNATSYISQPCQSKVTSPHCLAYHGNLLPIPPMCWHLHKPHVCNTPPTNATTCLTEMASPP
jgi:hypothetical protein